MVTDGSRKEWDFINEADLLGQNLNPVANFNDRSSIGESQQKRYRASDGPYPVLPLDSRNLSPAALQVQVDGSDNPFEISARALEFLTLNDSKFADIINSFKGCVPHREREADVRFADPILLAHRQKGGLSGKTRKSAKQWKKVAEEEMEAMFTCILNVCNATQRSKLAKEWGDGMTAKDVRRCVKDWSLRITQRINP